MLKHNILIVEDEGIVARDLQLTLERLGYRVAGTTASGEVAIEMARCHLPDLVLMDIVLKGQLDGIEAAAQIREALGIPVIYLTAYADKETMEWAKLTQPLGYLLKPFEDWELHEVVETALQHRLEQRVHRQHQGCRSHRWGTSPVFLDGRHLVE